jgi:hypothetical protein
VKSGEKGKNNTKARTRLFIRPEKKFWSSTLSGCYSVNSIFERAPKQQPSSPSSAKLSFSAFSSLTLLRETEAKEMDASFNIHHLFIWIRKGHREAEKRVATGVDRLQQH